MDNPLDRKALEELKVKKIAQELELERATEDSIRLARNFTAELESYNPVTRCLVVYAMDKTYRKMFPAVFEALKKLGV